MLNFFYQVGSVITTKPWYRPTYDRVRGFFLDETIQPLAKRYNIHIVGGFLYNKLTWDLDLALVYDYDDQTNWSLIEEDIDTINDTALNRHGLLLDACLVNKIHPLPTELYRTHEAMHILIKSGYRKKIVNDKIEFEHDPLKLINSSNGKIIQLGKYLVKSDRRGLRYAEKYTNMVFRIKNRDEAIEHLNYIDFLNMSEEDYQVIRIELNETI